MKEELERIIDEEVHKLEIEKKSKTFESSTTTAYNNPLSQTNKHNAKTPSTRAVIGLASTITIVAFLFLLLNPFESSKETKLLSPQKIADKSIPKQESADQVLPKTTIATSKTVKSSNLNKEKGKASVPILYPINISVTPIDTQVNFVREDMRKYLNNGRIDATGGDPKFKTINVPAGTYELVFTAVGYEQTYRTFTVPTKKALKHLFKVVKLEKVSTKTSEKKSLTPILRTVNINTCPEGATVEFVGNNSKKFTNGSKLPPGKYTIKVTAHGFNERLKSFELKNMPGHVSRLVEVNLVKSETNEEAFCGGPDSGQHVEQGWAIQQ